MPWLLVLLACAHTPVRMSYVDTAIETLEVQGDTGVWAPATPTVLVPLGRWLRVGDVVAFSYLDSQEGLSVRWQSGPAGAPRSVQIRRLSSAPAGMTVLSDAEAASYGTPDWLANYGPQPPAGALYGLWRQTPGLSHRFHPDFPDDVRAVIGEGSANDLLFEIVWVRLLTCAGRRCEATLLNQPSHLPRIHQGDRLALDLTGVADDRLPAAARVGESPPPALVSAAATAPALAGMLQDVDAWTVAGERPVGERLVPVGQWGMVGEEVVYLFYNGTYPTAVVFSDPVRFEVLPWAPKGLVLIDDARRKALKLPESPGLQNLPPQPPAGLYGTWRADPLTASLFNSGDDPDRAVVVVGTETIPGGVRVRGCDKLVCWGALTEDHPPLRAGTPMRFPHAMREQIGAGLLPVAEPAR